MDLDDFVRGCERAEAIGSRDLFGLDGDTAKAVAASWEKLEIRDVGEIAAACHDVRRRFAEALGDERGGEWSTLRMGGKHAIARAVMLALRGMTPEEVHSACVAEREAAGWKPDDPAMRPWVKLTPAERAAGVLFVRMARAMAAAITEAKHL